jgi:hypothetical protein
MASFWYGTSIANLLKKDATNAVDLEGDTIKITLIDAGYTPDKDHDFADDFVSATNECNVTNFTRGFGGTLRKTLASATCSYKTAEDRVEFEAANVTWTAIGGATNDTIATAVVLKELGGVDSASPMVLQLDINPDVTTNGGDFTISFSATDGIGYVSV